VPVSVTIWPFSFRDRLRDCPFRVPDTLADVAQGVPVRRKEPEMFDPLCASVPEPLDWVPNFEEVAETCQLPAMFMGDAEGEDEPLLHPHIKADNSKATGTNNRRGPLGYSPGDLKGLPSACAPISINALVLCSHTLRVMLASVWELPVSGHTWARRDSNFERIYRICKLQADTRIGATHSLGNSCSIHLSYGPLRRGA